MQYLSFRVKNFKGIKDTTVELKSLVGANVFAFVGLNESGKTTVLEAIHSFSPDDATSELLAGEKGIGVPYTDRVPRHLISEFTGDVSVKATLSVNNDDKENIAKILKKKHNLVLDVDHFPNIIVLEREQTFKDGDFQGNYFTLRTDLQVRSEKQRKWRKANHEESIFLRDISYELAPTIAYFPTFIFDFPESFYLTQRGGAVDRFYSRVFQDILDYDGRGHTIQKDIVRRVRGEDKELTWLSFLSVWRTDDNREKIDHVMDRAGAAVTKLVFGRWNAIFGEDSRGKEIVITYDVVQGIGKDAAGNKVYTHKHDIQVKFKIKDGTRRFDVNDRSLGFRWFFSFMLFTQFRVARSSGEQKPILFLFDEPASNLHAAAQQKLIDSFPEIATGQHVLAYSTHSHYMIEPKWLEQTFIVTNRSDNPSSSVLEEISLDDESLDVQVAPYRSFVNNYPGQTSYFQPILDRLEVVPSRFDAYKPSIVLEGKSDYYIIRYAQRLLGRSELPLLPGLGAGTLGALAALNVGWNLNFLFVLDGDAAGKKEKDRYLKEFGIKVDRLATLDELVHGLTIIEDLLDEDAHAVLREKLILAKNPRKDQIRRFFQESLASDSVAELGEGFAAKAAELLDKLALRLGAG